VEPSYYSVDVYAGTRYLADQTMLVVLDWSPSSAAAGRRQLNSLLRSAAKANRALGSDLREYRLEGWLLGDEGLRIGTYVSWIWRYQPTADELGDTIWWQL
jgi:hypothetical protein